MQRPLGLGAIALGVGLLIWGLQRSNSFNSDVSEFFTGSPPDEVMWLYIGGAVAIAVGVGLMLPWRGASRD